MRSSPRTRKPSVMRSSGVSVPEISRCATLAFDRAATAGWAPRRLFHVALQASRFEEMAKFAQAAGMPENPIWKNAQRLALPEDQVTTVVDAMPWVGQKRRALAAHRTQINPWLRTLPEDLMLRLLGRESFAQVRGEITAESRADLIAGL